MNFHLRPKETNVSHCGESVLNHFFQDVTEEGLLPRIGHSGVSLNFSNQQKLLHKMI